MLANDLGKFLTPKQILTAREVRVIDDPKAAENYWTARANVYPLIQTIFDRANSEDVTVPRNKIDNPKQCCGGAGTYFMEYRETAESIRAKRLEDINNTKSDIILTQCPVCRFYLGFQVTEREVTHPIKILAQSYGL